MKTQSLSLPARFALSAAALAACASFAAAQDSYIEHTIDSTFANAAALESLSQGPNGSAGFVSPSWESAERNARLYYLGGQTVSDKDGKTVAAPVPFWKEIIFSVSYQFERDLFDGVREDTHSVSPRIYLETTGGLSLQLSYSYDHHTTDIADGATEDGDEHSVSIKAGQDLFRLFKLKSKDTLTFDLQFGYGNNQARLDLPFFHSHDDLSEDIYTLTPELIYVHPINDRVAITLAASYEVRWFDEDFGNTHDSDNNSDLGVLGRVDVRLCKRVTADVEVGYDHLFAVSGGIDRDSAVFGAGIRYDFNERASVKVGYDYTAFLPETDEHVVFVRAEYHF
jgi:hypothetical protein